MNEKFVGKILIVDDEEHIRNLLLRILEKDGYVVKEASSGEECLEISEGFCPDLVLLDVTMPQLNGFQAMTRLREIDEHLPIIFVTAHNQHSDIIKGLDAGANDYITKPFVMGEILARVRTHLKLRNMNQQLRKANKELQELAEIDDLTDLYNMRSAYKRIDCELERARRFKHRAGIIMMDIDDFKVVNDSHDHLFGSFVLSEIGKIIRKSIRSVDFGARFGGDEFMIMLTVTGEEGIKVFCERLRGDIEKHHFVSGEDKTYLTASFGFCLTSSENSKVRSEELVRLADSSLYDAKHSGKNRVRGKSENDKEIDCIVKIAQVSANC
jgi:diguanylate cyclase (GGDEF)-like protein